MHIGVCGASSGRMASKIVKASYQVGVEVARHGGAVVTGGTTGYSAEAAKGAKVSGGVTIGISPADDLEAHVGQFKLPADIYVHLIFTGLGFKGRNTIIVQSCDAVIFIGGGTGTLNEMCTAVDAKKIMGVLKGSGGAAELTKELKKISLRNKPVIVSDKDGKKLVNKVINALKRRSKL